MSELEPVLVLGATSLVGRFLTPRLLETGVAFTAVSRSARSEPHWVTGDLKRPVSLAAIGTAEQVYSLSPIWLLPSALSALRDLGMRRLVAFSSTSRFTKTEAASDYERGVAKSLADGEAAVTAFCSASGIGYTIIRPTLIYAEGLDGNVSRLAGLIRRLGLLPLPGAGRGLRQPVHASDLADLAMLAMAAEPENRAYDATGGETLSYRTMVERIFEGMGRTPRVVSLPEPLVGAAYALAKPLFPGSTRGMIDRINQDLVFDPDPIRAAFGWTGRDFHPSFQQR